MTAEQAELRTFSKEFYEESGIVLRNRTGNYVRGSLGYGHDSGIGPENILSAIVRSPEIKYYNVNALGWGPTGSLDRVLISINDGEVFVYTDDLAGDDPVSLIGDIHDVRKIGKYINDKVSPHEAIKRGQSIHENSSFGWFQGRTRYDNFSPNELKKELSLIAKKYRVRSNPALYSFDERSLVFELFANIDDDCYVISHIDTINIIGWEHKTREVSKYFEKLFKKRGVIKDMTKLDTIAPVESFKVN